MAPTVRLKGPTRGSNNVSIYSVIVTTGSSKTKKTKNPTSLKVTIRLPKETLKRIHQEDEVTKINEASSDVLTDKSMMITLKYSPKKEKLQQARNDTIVSDYTPKTESNIAFSSERVEEANNTKEPSHSILNNVGYRNIPSNLIFLLKREFGFLNETQEEMEMIDKMVFTLRDPLTAKKIKLPIKSVGCTHFECFDFDNFCVFNHLPYGVRYALRKDLIKKSTDLKKKHKYFADDKAPMNSVVKEFKYQPNYTNMAYFKPPKGVNSSQHHFPTYKCPVCNRAFLLNQLFISDVLNYFVKTTPMDIDRIELRDMVKYRIVDEKEMVKEVPQENVVVLSDDDNSDDNETTTQIDDKQRSKSSSGHDGPWGSSLNDPFDSDQDTFGSDDSFLLSYNRYKKQTQSFNTSSSPNNLLESTQIDSYAGSGSWEDPVNLD